MIALRNLTIEYDNSPLLRNLNMSFPENRLVAMLGCNGAGKSTLLRVMAGLQAAGSGAVLYDGIPINEMSAGDRAKAVSFVNTERVRIANLRCSDLVALGRAPYTDWLGNMRGSDRKAVEDALEAVDMAGYASRTMDTMSDGECQRIMVARALAQDTPVMLLDEPAAFLDLPNKYRLAKLLHRLASEKGKTVIFSTHDLDVAIEESDEIVLVTSSGLMSGTPSEMLSSGLIGKVFGLEKYMTASVCGMRHPCRKAGSSTE